MKKTIKNTALSLSILFCITTLSAQTQQAKAQFTTIQSDLKTIRYLSFRCEHKVLIDAKGLTSEREIKVKAHHKYIVLPFKYWTKKRLANILVLGDNCKSVKFTENYILINDEFKIFRDDNTKYNTKQTDITGL